MNELRAQLVDALPKLDSERWRSSPLRQAAQGSTRWVAAASLKPINEGPSLELGLSDQGRWVVQAADGSVADVDAAGEYLPLFPVLEMTYHEARDALAQELRSRDLDEGWITLFPFDAIAASAIKSGSKFWPDLALRWINNLELTTSLIEALVILQKEGKTQHQRHQARHLLARARRSSKEQ